uniref:Uncharacterized protein n=4 Tax=Avena sativa TaxID=4498 RepID=A0ACD5Z523_AVESA
MGWERFKQIVNLVIQLRGISPLAKCEIRSFHDAEDAKLWIQYALMCQVTELIVISDDTDEDAPVLCYDAPFISQHLKSLEFFDVNLEGSSLDFSNCPALEHLKMGTCRVRAPSISFQSLKHLCIANSCTFPQDFRLRIVAPELILLELDGFDGLTPSLGHMPFLVTAYIGLGYECHDFCTRNGQGCENHRCGCHAYPVDKGLVINGLSNTVNLELIAQPKRSFTYGI